MKHWARRAAALHDELAAIADVRDPRWWIVAGGAALDWNARAAYVISDGEPASDTFIGYARPHAATVADPIARAHAARDALRELDGQLPQQPLAVTLLRTDAGARVVPSSLTTVAFAAGDRCWCALLDSPTLADDLRAFLAGGSPAPAPASETPFACISIGDEPLATARHGHRRGWRANRGPWLGLGRSGELEIISTCHFVVDGYGHARLTARIAELTARHSNTQPPDAIPPVRDVAPVRDAIPLSIIWREIPTGLRALPLAYALGQLLHELAGDRDARFSPTFQIPIAPGAPGDGDRIRRRVVPSITSVRFDRGEPEPFEVFAARTKEILAREAGGNGLTSRLLAAARAVPAPLAWKRNAISVQRPGWLDPIATVVGGRGCVSRIELEAPAPPMCAVSSPARIASPHDPLGACVVTVIDDGVRAAITLCGSGDTARPERLAEILERVPTD